VLAEDEPPPEEPDEPASIPPRAIDPPRTSAARSVLAVGDVSTDPTVIATNAALSIIVLMLLLLSAEVFNQTVEENEEDIKKFFGRVFAPVVALFGWIGGIWSSLTSSGTAGSHVIGALFLMGLAGIIYTLPEPDFGANERTFVTFFSVVISVGILTYSFDGGQVLMGKRYGVDAIVRLFPYGIFIAVISAIMTKVEDFDPAIIYGFIGASAVVGGRSFTREQQGRVIFIPALFVIVVSAAAWILIDPLRNWAEDTENWLPSLLEGVAAGVFIGGLSSLFFQMIPIRFMDGRKLWDWNKLAWLFLTGIAVFLFFHVLMGQERESFDALGESAPRAAIGIMLVCVLITFTTWLFFKIRADEKDRL
jgi:hypothetical protein